jgi:putative RecB family exonuclease
MSNKKHLPLLDYAPWSPSKADLASKCGLAFKYRYIDKVETGPKGPASKIGTAVHKIQELVLEGTKLATAVDQALLTSSDGFTHSETEQVLTFSQSVLDFCERIDTFKVKHPVAETLIECKWAITADFEPCDFFDDAGILRGVVDFGLLLTSGHLIIIDHKSGKLRPIKNYGTQLDMYAIMGQVHNPDIKGVQCAINFMAYDELVWSEPKSSSYVKTVLRPWLLDFLNTKSNSIAGYNPRAGYYCKWCDFRNICPEYETVNGKETGD